MKKSLIILPVTIIVLVIVFLVYKLIPKPPCESIFQQTSLRLSSKLDIIKSKGPEVSIEEQKIQDLTERSQMTALNLKTCCIVLEGGKVNSEEFLRCKDNAEKFETQVEKIATNINEAQAAKQEGKTELVNEQVSEINQNINVAKQSSEEFRKQVTELQAPQPTETTEKKETSQGGSEQEPNNTIFEASSFPIDGDIFGKISSTDDQDYFKFHSTSNLRDRMKVNLENQSTTLAPDIFVYDQNKSQMIEKFDGTAGATLEFEFVAETGKDYYLRINPYGTIGDYKLSVKPQTVYDGYEPNDDIFSAKLIETGQPIAANILDEKDTDWFKITGITGKKITVRFENQSTTLAPDIYVYDHNKSQMFEKYNGTSGADLEFSFDTEPGKDYYLNVRYYGGSGKYKFIVNQE